jgi:hypothetical protein
MTKLHNLDLSGGLKVNVESSQFQVITIYMPSHLGVWDVVFR